MIKHNVFLQPQSDKVIVLMVLDKKVFGELPNQSYVIGTTSKNIYSNMNPQITLDMSNVFEADKFWEMCEHDGSAKGSGIAGIVTEGPWFCQTLTNPLAEMIGDTI